MDRLAAAHVLEQIAAHLELRGDSEFRVRAFRNAAHTVEDFTGDLEEAARTGALGDLKGIGPATLDVVRECFLAGRSSTLEQLKLEVPPGLVEMTRISGLGVAKIRALHERLRITTLAELEVAAGDGRLAKLPRFGEKTAQRILRGIEYLRRTGDSHLLHHGLRQAEQLRRAIAGLPGVVAVDVAGSVRRRCELVRDVDLAVAATCAPAELSTRVAAFSGVRDVVGAGDATFTVHFDDAIPAKIWVGPPAMFGHLLVRATGSRAHLELLVREAGRHGLELDAQGLRRGGAAVPCPDEASLYRSLGLAPIPAELREGRDEVERAARGALPVLVRREDLRGFVHCHTVYSDGANTVAEVAEACRAAGYGYVGITDHSVAAAFAGGLTEEVIARQHAEIDAYNAGQHDIRVLKGIEADILPDGRLDYAPGFLDRFDFVIASIHTRLDLAERAMTERMLRAIDDPHTSIIGHPTGRLLLGREGYAIDMAAVIARAAERGVAIEINADPQRLDLDWRQCIAAREAGMSIPIGADAHSIAGMSNVDLGVGMARKAALTKDDVLNARDVEGFLEHAKSRR
jgi:DNA polymerase (family 10)